MRRFLRILAGLGVGGLGLVLVAVVATLAPVDQAPFAGRRYAVETLRRLEGSKIDVAGEGPVRAGFGRARLTPTIGAAVDAPERGEFVALPLAGYGNRRGRPATGVHDDIWVKAVAFAVGGQTGVVVAADALIIPREISAAARERLRARFGLAADRVYFGATHSHCSLGGWGEGWVAEAFAGGYHPGVRIWFARQLALAAESALTNLAPASLGMTAFAAPDLTRNRLVGDGGPIDPEFDLMLLRQADGTRAVVGSYAAHATVLSGGMMEFSGDYPGEWQRAMERRGFAMAVFLAGGVGSHAPKPPAGGLEGIKRMGEMLAERTERAQAELAWRDRLEVRMQTLEVDLPDPQPRVTDGWRMRSWLARRLLPVGDRTVLQAWRLGDWVWLSTPCDYSGELALPLKEAARRAGLRAVVTSFNGDYVGYVVPSKYYHRDGYETRTMAFFGPQLPDYFDDLLHRLVSGMAGEARGSVNR